MDNTNRILIRFAGPSDCSLILSLIRGLAEYEKLSDQVVASEELLNEWIFEKKKAEVLIAECNGQPAGFALFFHNFSTFLARAGIYLEDLYVRPNFRGKGVGTALLSRLAQLTLERRCGRLEWSCLDWNTPSVSFYRNLGAVPMTGWTTFRVTGLTLESLAKQQSKL